MTKARTGRRALSLLLTLCMALCLLPAVALSARAADISNWVGSESLTYGEDSAGTGWTWDSAGKVLTLSGVNASNDSRDALHLSGKATVVLEGTNVLTPGLGQTGLYCGGGLTIKGSGTLEVNGAVGGNGIYAGDQMKIESGCISADCFNWAIKSEEGISVYGGYVSATADGASAAAVRMGESQSFVLLSGYVKAEGTVAGIDGPVTVHSGYLEATGTAAESSGINGSVNNTGGVIKAVGVQNGIGSTYSFIPLPGSTGSVTIAKATAGSAIKGNIFGLSEDGQKLYDNSGTEPTLIANDYTGSITSTCTSVVIAKEAQDFPYQGADIGGVYVKSVGMPWGNGDRSRTLTVSGGSYLEGDGNAIALDTVSLTVNKTLVCVGCAGVSANEVAIDSNSTLFSSSPRDQALKCISFTSAGNLIAFTGGNLETGIQCVGPGTVRVTDGYVYSVAKSTALSAPSLSIEGGYLTAHRTADGGPGLAVSDSTIVTGGAVTAIGSLAYEGAEAEADQVPGEAAYDSVSKHYLIGGQPARVLTFKPIPPEFDDCFGGDCSSDTYTVGDKHPAKGYTFAGWFLRDENDEYTGDAVTAYEVGAVYYAKWTNDDGITVRTTPLDVTKLSGVTDKLESEGWSWASTSELLFLIGATIDCSGSKDWPYAVCLPNNTTVILEDGTENTILAGVGPASPSEPEETKSTGIFCADAGSITIGNNGSLDVTAAEATYISQGVFGSVIVGGTSDSPIVTITGGDGGSSHGVNGSLTVYRGDVTVVSGELTDPSALDVVTQAIFDKLNTFGVVRAGDSAGDAGIQTSAATYYPKGKYVNVFCSPPSLALEELVVTATSISIAAGMSNEAYEYAVTPVSTLDAPENGWVGGTGSDGGTVSLGAAFVPETGYLVWVRAKEVPDSTPASFAVSTYVCTAFATPVASDFVVTQPAVVDGTGSIAAVAEDISYEYRQMGSGGTYPEVWTELPEGGLQSIEAPATFQLRVPKMYGIPASEALVIEIREFAGTTVPVIVDGEAYNIGTAITSGGVTTVTLDQPELQKQLAAASESVVIPVTPGTGADAVTVQLIVANVQEMAEKDMTLAVQVDNVSFDMPAVAIDTASLMTKLGATDPDAVPVNVTIGQLAEEDVSLEEGELVLPPVEFVVTATFGGSNVEVEVFENYVQRVIELPDAGTAAAVSTAVVVENGKQRHVPTEVFEKGGKWYAEINSLTNSVYALIHNEVSFADAADSWFEGSVNEMASRGIVSGRSAGVYDGEADITRAEFAAILVRALGLPQDGDASVFLDVSADAWYYGAVGKAYEYGLIFGRTATAFDPTASITREEAMAMVCRASATTEFAGTQGELTAFPDADSVSDWALGGVKWCVGSSLIFGSDGNLCPLDNITRAESAALILRLLQRSGLVDTRPQA